MAPMAFMVLAAAAAACASTHGCPLASDDGFLTAEDTPTRSSSHEFRRDETNPTSPARHSTTKFLSLPIGVEVTPTFDYNFWRYDQRSITFRDSYSTPKPAASLWNSTIFIIFGQPFLDYVDDNLSGFEAWAWASCPDTGTYYKFANGYLDSTSEVTLPNQDSPPDGAGEPDWSYASGSYARGQSWHAHARSWYWYSYHTRASFARA